jgi:hypothetical protein
MLRGFKPIELAFRAQFLLSLAPCHMGSILYLLPGLVVFLSPALPLSFTEALAVRGMLWASVSPWLSRNNDRTHLTGLLRGVSNIIWLREGK